MKQQKRIELNFSRMYGFKTLDGKARSALASKIGQGKGPMQQMLGSKIGGKFGIKTV